MAGLPHQGRPAQFRHPVEERAARLHIGDDRRTGAVFEHIFGIDHQELIAPDHPARAVDRADPVAIAVKSHAEVEVLGCDKRAQIGEIGFHSRIRMVVGEMAVDLGKQQMMFPGQPGCQRFERGASRTVPGIPADLETGERRGIDPGQSGEQALDIFVHDIARGDGAGAAGEIPRRGQRAEPLDIGAEERTPLEYHLEAIVIGGVMAAGYLNAAIHFFA